MFKTLALIVALLGTVSLSAQGQKASAAISPPIVAKGKLIHQASTIPISTIFTPPATGMYRISVYMATTTADPTSQSAWLYNFQWTDDAGAESSPQLIYCYGNGVSSGAYGFQASGAPGLVFPFEAVAGIPVTYSVTQSSNPDSSVYSLYYVVERLE